MGVAYMGRCASTQGIQALYQTILENLGQRFIVGIQEMCVHSFEAIGPVVPEISCSQTNWNTDSWSSKLCKPILANRDGICKIGHMRVDHMTIEILCTDLRDFWIKSQGVISKNVFYISRPKGGAIKGWCEKCRAKVYPQPLGSALTKFETDRWSYR